MQYKSPVREPLILGNKDLHDISVDIARPIETKANRWWWALFTISFAAMLWLFGCIAYLIGTGVALITPFNEDFSIDFSSLDNLINHLLNNNVDYFVVMGTSGESATLTLEEQDAILSHVKKTVNNRVPIVLGIGGNNTNRVLHRLKSIDFSGILSSS